MAGSDSQSQENADPGNSNRTLTYSASLMAFFEDPDSGYNPRAAYFSQVSSYVTTYIGGSTYLDSYEQKTKAQMISAMQCAPIVFVHSHGAAGCITIGTASPNRIYSFDFSSNDLANQRCVVLLTCKGGYPVSAPSYNMVQTMVNCGATCAVGFTTDISVANSNTFAIGFAKQTLMYHKTVALAINTMQLAGDPISGYAVISGTASTLLY